LILLVGGVASLLKLATFSVEVVMTASGNQSSDSMSTARDRAHNMAGRVVDKVQETASRIAGTVQDVTMPPGNQAGGQSEPLMDQATDQITSRLDMGKEYVAGTMTGVAQALRQTGQHLREEGAQPMLASYADRGAEQIERFGSYLRHREASQLVEDVEQFARRQPLAFAGSAFALGMLAVRFIRSERPTRGQASTSPMSASAGSVSGAGFSSNTSSTPPGGYTAAAQAALHRTPASQSDGGPGQAPGMNPGTPAAPGPGAGIPGTQSERPTPRPVSAPSVGASAASTGTTPPKPAPSAQTGGGSSTSERTGSGSRNQP
jgi:hypothetical protein